MMEPVCELPMPPAALSELVCIAKDYMLSHGAIMRTKDKPESAEVVTYAPFVLLPSPVPKACFQQAVSVQKDFNLLIHKVAHDFQFLNECLRSVVKVDDFTRRLWRIYETVHSEGNIKPVSLAMNRSDYMFHSETSVTDLSAGPKICRSLRQIEINTIASSFAGLSRCVTQYHRYILKQCKLEEKINQLPENNAVQGLAEAMYLAWQRYECRLAVVLFLVLPVEGNTYDQRWLEYAIQDIDANVKVIRRSIHDIAERAKLTRERRLIIDDMEVAVVYQRTCYVPGHFKTEGDWDARLMLERSRAVICPNTGYHLAGTKKVQQMLSEPGTLERFLAPDAAARVRATFAGQFTLDWGEEGDENIASALREPHKFVLKPQREGGGNNTFGEDLRALLSSIKDSEERQAYIMMERISPAVNQNYSVKSNEGSVMLRRMVSELGVFGTLVGTKDEVLLNEQRGHMLRTKPEGVDEGGVATGYSALDSPYLV